MDQIDKATRELNGHARALRDFLNSANDLDFIKAKKVLPISPVRAGELIIGLAFLASSKLLLVHRALGLLPSIARTLPQISKLVQYVCSKQTQFGGLVPHDRPRQWTLEN